MVYSHNCLVVRSFSCPRMRPRTLRSPGCCGGRHLARGAQEAEKTHAAPFATHLSYALEISNVTMTMCKDLGFDILALRAARGREVMY